MLSSCLFFLQSCYKYAQNQAIDNLLSLTLIKLIYKFAL